MRVILLQTLLLLTATAGVAHAQPKTAARETLEQQLRRENPETLAKAVRELGDARRGAILFLQAESTCTLCHSDGSRKNTLGPDLSRFEKKPSDAQLIESILHPSKVVRKGYEGVNIVTADGKIISGLLVKETAQALTLKVVSRKGKLVTIAKADIDDRSRKPVSIMPKGLVNHFASRQQFLDLARYVFDIAQNGPDRAAELRPPAWLYAARPLPAYEKNIDHAGMIRGLNRASFKRGQAIYNRLCINCHGTKDRPGSLPTSLRFASGKFKNGSDPYRMYQTLTRGFGMMVRQSWMVPQQKYDVIHYVREAYLKPHNPSQYFRVDDSYLASLPTGSSRGPKPSNILAWERMDYGDSLTHTYEIGRDGTNFAYKGVAVRLDPGPGGVSRGRSWMVFDHDTLRMAAGWTGRGFIDWNGIMFNGRHAIHPRVVGDVEFSNPTGPGWANPATGTFDDPRMKGRDGRRYGPLPRAWAHYKGQYYHGDKSILSYTVGKTSVLEMPGRLATNNGTVFTRTFHVGPRDREMVLNVATHVKGRQIAVGKFHKAIAKGALRIRQTDRRFRLHIAAGTEPLKFVVWIARGKNSAVDRAFIKTIESQLDVADLKAFTNGGPPRWPAKLTTTTIVGDTPGPFAIDVFPRPVNNPWFARVRFTGVDFYPGGNSAAVCTWDGDVWKVDGLRDPQGKLTWRRIASGLFQPLGILIIDGKIHLGCRDQICILHDLNGDGETDYYENFNNDHQVTEHFHEFAMGLQRDAAGDFYYAKSARHAKTALVPHHGTLLRVSKDGSQTEILATGFRAANGVCLNPDGTFIVTDQEGHWNPKNRINWVTRGGFYGNMYGYHDVEDSSDAAMQQPLCWITNKFDRSPAELLWVKSKKWGPLNGSLLNFSYGYGKVYIVPHEKVNGQMQGGMCAFPIPQFPTGVIRGRFSKADGQLYLCGMFAWAGSQRQPGGFYRLRYTGKPVHLPVGLNATKTGMKLTFSGPLDPRSIKAASFRVKTWDLKRTKRYGSKHYNEKPLGVKSARLLADGKTVVLELPGIKPTWCMEIRYSLRSRTGKVVDGTIHNTVHHLAR